MNSADKTSGKDFSRRGFFALCGLAATAVGLSLALGPRFADSKDRLKSEGDARGKIVGGRYVGTGERAPLGTRLGG